MTEHEHFPFEIHITVEHGDVDMFRETCKGLNIKPVLLDLQKDKQVVMKDMMTSSTLKNTFSFVEDEIKRISEGLEDKGFKVVRVKVETSPWHPKAPSKDNLIMPKDCYFESHIGIILQDEKEESKILHIAKNYNCHMSQNVFKKHSENKNVVKMMTFRKYDGTSEEFIDDVKKITEALEKENISFEKVIHEFALYDTKIHHDNSWIKN